MTSELHRQYQKILNAWQKEQLRNKNIELIILGGSVARGDETKFSDIDVSIYYNNKFIIKAKRQFYKYRTKYIEQTNYDIADFKLEDVLKEQKILFDAKGYTKLLSFSKSKNKARFLKKYKDANESLKLAEMYYSKQDYENATLHLMGTKSFAFITVHALPELFDLPYPTFKLLSSIKQISKDTKIDVYKEYINLWTIKNNPKIITNFEKIYKIMGPLNNNEGFYSKEKIHENMLQIIDTLKKYPKEYANRFIIGCVIDWALDKDTTKNKQLIINLTKEILSINEFDNEFTEQKLLITKQIKKEIDEIIKQF
jgi:predicted nucleotidyltransferase